VLFCTPFCMVGSIYKNILFVSSSCGNPFSQVLSRIKPDYIDNLYSLSIISFHQLLTNETQYFGGYWTHWNWTSVSCRAVINYAFLFCLLVSLELHESFFCEDGKVIVCSAYRRMCEYLWEWHKMLYCAVLCISIF